MGKLRDIENKISKEPKSAVAKLSEYKRLVAAVKIATGNLTPLLQRYEDEVQALISDASTNDKKAAIDRLTILKREIKYFCTLGEEISGGVYKLR